MEDWPTTNGKIGTPFVWKRAMAQSCHAKRESPNHVLQLRRTLLANLSMRRFVWWPIKRWIGFNICWVEGTRLRTVGGFLLGTKCFGFPRGIAPNTTGLWTCYIQLPPHRYVIYQRSHWSEKPTSSFASALPVAASSMLGLVETTIGATSQQGTCFSMYDILCSILLNILCKLWLIVDQTIFLLGSQGGAFSSLVPCCRGHHSATRCGTGSRGSHFRRRKWVVDVCGA